MMRDLATIIAEADADPAMVAELNEAIDLERRRTSNAIYAESRRTFEHQRQEYAAALAAALGEHHAALDAITAERDQLQTELAALKGRAPRPSPPRLA